MPEATRLKHGGSKKHGRNKEKCKRYRAANTRERNKLRRVLRSSGLVAAQAYAEKHGLKPPASAYLGG